MNNSDFTAKVNDLENLIDKDRNFPHAEIEANRLLEHLSDHGQPDEVTYGTDLHCRVLLALSESLWRRGLAAEALGYTEESYSIAQRLHNTKHEAKSCGFLGIVHRHLADYPRALNFAQQALALDAAMHNTRGMAINHNNIGLVYQYLSDYPRALEHLSAACALYEELGERGGVAAIYGNMGLVYHRLADFPKALECFNRALSLNEALNNARGMANDLGNIGLTYHYLADYPRAIDFLSRALALNEQQGYSIGIARNSGSIGIVYQSLHDYSHAFEYYGKALAISEELHDKSGVALHSGNIGSMYAKLNEYDRALEFLGRALILYEEISDKNSVAINTLNIASVYVGLADFVRALEYIDKAHVLFEEIENRSGVASCLNTKGLIYASVDNSSFDSQKAEELLLQALTLYRELGLKHEEYELSRELTVLYERQQRWIDVANHYKLFHELYVEVQNEEATKQAQLMENRRTVEEAERDRQVKLARFQEQEKIFHNILPVSIAERLIEGEKTIAESFDNVSILFCDIVGFTSLSSRISATDLVEGLNNIFTEFDRLATKHGLEKIKTIGDAYMAACGVPVPCDDHALRTARFALDVRDAMTGRTIGEQNIPVHVRIGLHCGSVIAGIIGEQKFAYDLWGDTVNTASRMESSSEPGKIHCTIDFAKELHNPYRVDGVTSKFLFEERGEITIKGKGLIKTCFLSGVE